MSDFESDFAAAGATQLLAVLGEDVRYTPRGGVARTIRMIVERQPPASIAGGRAQAPKFRLTCLNDPTDGIDGPTFNAGGDVVELSTRAGGGATLRIALHALPAEQDDGMLVFEL